MPRRPSQKDLFGNDKASSNDKGSAKELRGIIFISPLKALTSPGVTKAEFETIQDLVEAIENGDSFEYNPKHGVEDLEEFLAERMMPHSLSALDAMELMLGDGDGDDDDDDDDDVIIIEDTDYTDLATPLN